MHGDLAARNVLIGENYSAKIGYISAYLYTWLTYLTYGGSAGAYLYGYKKSQSTA